MKQLIATTVFIIISQFVFAQNFTGSFDLVIGPENPDVNSRSDTLSFFFGENKKALIIHARGNQPDLRLVFSPKDSTITGLFIVNEKKGGYILPMNKKYWPSMDYALRDYGTGPRKQLNTANEQKEINGYLCNKMVCSFDKLEATFWIANEIELSLVQVLAYQTVGAGKDDSAVEMLANCGIQGFSMLAKIHVRERKDPVLLSILNLNDTFDDAIFSTEGHTLADMTEQ
ncbi:MULTISPECIES: hypothetical protein [Aequorivita]|uniref:DUF4412 domain-containing protein n=2 Tax=Aequorivita TaxID=153265 RepID=A0AB35YYZ2_9FLAO|nr:hypothetical protein [Aequorivita sp. Ant34-E75]WGF92359.1 hypothetical protein QCQ61_14260 [Aequorivita sp. Ant34-E75]